MRLIVLCTLLLCLWGNDTWANGRTFHQDSLPARIAAHNDNDLLFERDRLYSNGMMVELTNIGFLRDLGVGLTHKLFGQRSMLSSFSFFFGQHIYTPNKIGWEGFYPEERPWAGWLFWKLRYKAVARLWSLQLSANIGLVGPYSLAEDFQIIWHTYLRSVLGTVDPRHPRGWKYQLGHEVTFQLTARVDRLMFEKQLSKEWMVDAKVHAKAELGTVFIRGSVGMTVRVGSMIRYFASSYPKQARAAFANNKDEAAFFALPKETLKTWGRRQKPWEFFFFASGRGLLVARNLFLDGSTFEESHSVPKLPLVCEVELGLSWKLHHFRLTASAILQTVEGAYRFVDPEGHRYHRVVLAYEGF